jgi:hypothetical protein
MLLLDLYLVTTAVLHAASSLIGIKQKTEISGWRLEIALGTKYREPKPNRKIPKTEPKNTEPKEFGSCSVLSFQEPKEPR